MNIFFLSAHTHPPSIHQRVPSHVPVATCHGTPKPKGCRTYCSGAGFQVLQSWAREALLGDVLPLEGLEPLLLAYLLSLSGSMLSRAIVDQECSCSAMEQSRGSCGLLETWSTAQPVPCEPFPTSGSSQPRGQHVFCRQHPAVSSHLL